MTAHYARLSDTTVREHWERARKVNAEGQPVQVNPDGPLGDAAWTKQRLSRATQALPNGYCQLPPVRPDPLSEAAARRHELTRSRAVQALRELDRAGVPVTFAGVAQAAGVSRSWLYTQPDISGQIRRLRQEANAAGSAGGIPSAQRATDASLRARLSAALDRNKQLADENARLRRQLARSLGDQRTARVRSGNDQEG